MKSHVWVLLDLGNGIEGETYIWVFPSRKEAREQAKLHKSSPIYARLSSIRKWEKSEVENKKYKVVIGNYYSKGKK